MIPTAEQYASFGVPAHQTLTVLKVPAQDFEITIGDFTYAMGTDFFGRTQHEVADSIAAAISQPKRDQHLANYSLILTSFYAISFGTKVLVISKLPGTISNDVAVATDDANVLEWAGATLGGGVPGITLDTEGGGGEPFEWTGPVGSEADPFFVRSDPQGSAADPLFAVVNNRVALATFLSLTAGETAAAFADLPAKEVVVINENAPTSTDAIVEIQRGVSGPVLQVFPGTSRWFGGIENTNELRYQRGGSTNVPFKAEVIQ